MKKNLEGHYKTPLYSELVKYALHDNTIPFDVPGHKKGNYKNEMHKDIGENLFKFDVNSMKQLDILSNPYGVIREAQELMADLYQADHAFFLVNGSTSGVQYMILSSCSPKDKIILPRNVHNSAISGLILSGAKPVYIAPEFDQEFGISMNVSYEDYRKTILQNKDAKAIFLTNPTYFGVVTDMKKVIDLAHSYNILVLVDEAHGALLNFSEDLPISASKAGADMVTISMHKTGGSLTQSSVLLLNDNMLDKSHVRSVINLTQTTSASYLLMASLDIARKNLAINGKELISNLVNISIDAQNKINKIAGLKCLGTDKINGRGIYGIHPLKLSIKVNDLGKTGFEIYDILRNEYNIQIELAEVNTILAIIGVGDNSKSINYLIDALKDLSKRFYNGNDMNEVDIPIIIPKMAFLPRDAFYHKKKLVELDEAENMISGEAIMIYPPGIPLVTPGEVITKEIIEYYYFLEEHNNTLIGVDYKKNQKLKIQILDLEEI